MRLRAKADTGYACAHPVAQKHLFILVYFKVSRKPVRSL